MAGLEKFCRNVFSHVLCPVDFSKPSEKTLEYAKRLGFIRHMTLLHVVNGKGSGPDRSAGIEECQKKLAAIETDLVQSGISDGIHHPSGQSRPGNCPYSR